MTKITVKLNATTWELLDEVVGLIGLRRDVYLAKVLPSELKEIRSQSWVNDEAGEKYLRKSALLFEGAWKQVSFSLPEEVAADIDALCRGKRVPRDFLVDAAVQFITYRILPFALVLNSPRGTLQFKTVNAILKFAVKRTRITDLDTYLETLSPDFYETQLHYTADKIAENEAVWQSVLAEVAERRRRPGAK